MLFPIWQFLLAKTLNWQKSLNSCRQTQMRFKTKVWIFKFKKFEALKAQSLTIVIFVLFEMCLPSFYILAFTKPWILLGFKIFTTLEMWFTIFLNPALLEPWIPSDTSSNFCNWNSFFQKNGPFMASIFVFLKQLTKYSI